MDRLIAHRAACSCAILSFFAILIENKEVLDEQHAENGYEDMPDVECRLLTQVHDVTSAATVQVTSLIVGSLEKNGAPAAHFGKDSLLQLARLHTDCFA